MIIFGFIVFLLLLALILYNRLVLKSTGLGSFDIQTTQNLRGWMILFVLIGHTCNFVLDKHSSFVVSNLAMWGNIAVCVFFFMSGYGLMYSYMSKGETYLNGFLRKRLTKILVPLIIATVVFLPVNYLFGDTTDNIIHNYMAGTPSLRFSWFCYTICVFYVAFWIIARRIKLYNGIIILTIVVCALYAILLHAIGWKVHWYSSTLSIPLGMLVCAREIVLRRFIANYSFICFLLLLLFFMITYASGVVGLSYYTISICVPLILYTLSLYFNAVFISNRFLHTENETIGVLGGFSFEIYLCHGAFITAISRLDLSAGYSVLCMIGAFPVILALSYCLKKISDIINSAIAK